MACGGAGEAGLTIAVTDAVARVSGSGGAGGGERIGAETDAGSGAGVGGVDDTAGGRFASGGEPGGGAGAGGVTGSGSMAMEIWCVEGSGGCGKVVEMVQ